MNVLEAGMRCGALHKPDLQRLFDRSGRNNIIVRDGGAFLARVDFAWPAFCLVVEIDGFAYHHAEGAFQTDRTRQNQLMLVAGRC